MSTKILVTYATRAGSTQGVAERIAQTLRANNHEVDLRLMQDVQDVLPYSAVIAGSAVRFDRWLPEAMQFLKHHQHDLEQKPFAPFLVCLTLAKPSPKATQDAKAYMQAVRELVTPMSEGLFAGALNMQKLPELRYRMLFQIPVLFRIFKEGDYRDWEAIDTWANSLSSEFVNTVSRS